MEQPQTLQTVRSNHGLITGTLQVKLKQAREFFIVLND